MQKKRIIKTISWLCLVVFFGIFFLTTILYTTFVKIYEEKIYKGIRIGGMDFGGKTRKEVQDFFDKKNASFSGTKFTFTYETDAATLSAKELQFGFNSKLLSDQAYSLGRSKNLLSDFGIILLSAEGETNLTPSYSFSEDVLRKALLSIEKKVTVEPVDAQFYFQNGRVIAFRLSSDGEKLDWEELLETLQKTAGLIGLEKISDTIIIPIPVKNIKPKVTTEDVNNLGIRELIGSGKSTFVGSIPNRVHNVTLAASRINGSLIGPGETFSFNKALGDVSKFTGYKEAYIIKEGKTILGDGGGVCQVSTTLFRAILNSGLSILERHSHSYRVGYYEQDMGPGFDATVYDPSFDLKFKNDTQHAILIQASIDPVSLKLQFDLYGTSDGRSSTISKQTITNEQPAPPDLYQDDPTLPQGIVKQVDFKAVGADVVFSRKVERNGAVLISDNFRSHYNSWQAVYLRGTKE